MDFVEIFKYLDISISFYTNKSLYSKSKVSHTELSRTIKRNLLIDSRKCFFLLNDMAQQMKGDINVYF